MLDAQQNGARELAPRIWTATLYDCDFTQMLGLTGDCQASSSIADSSHEALANRQIVSADRSEGCTGSSGGSTT